MGTLLSERLDGRQGELTITRERKHFSKIHESRPTNHCRAKPVHTFTEFRSARWSL